MAASSNEPTHDNISKKDKSFIECWKCGKYVDRSRYIICKGDHLVSDNIWCVAGEEVCVQCNGHDRMRTCWKCSSSVCYGCLFIFRGNHKKLNGKWCPTEPKEFRECHDCGKNIKNIEYEFCFDCEQSEKFTVLCKGTCGYRCGNPKCNSRPICYNCQDPGNADSDHSVPYSICGECGLMVCEGCSGDETIFMSDAPSDGKYADSGLCIKCYIEKKKYKKEKKQRIE